MKSHDPRTWILIQCTSFPPDDIRLQLGQVLTDPRLPQNPLFASTVAPPPVMEGMTVAENQVNGVTMGMHSHLARCFNLWANVSTLGIPADAELRAAEMQGASFRWHFDALVDRATSFDSRHVAAVLRHPLVREYIDSKRRSSWFFRAYPPLYIVTGVRIARGARMEAVSATSSDSGAGFDVNARWPGTVGTGITASAGVGARLSQASYDHSSFDSANDFIFAYQCTQIKYRMGVRQKVYTGGDTLRTYLPDLLNNGDDEGELEVGDPPFFPYAFGDGEGDVEENEILTDGTVKAIVAAA
ncbi:512c292a-6255-4351-bd38-07fdc7e3b867 [Thermothielavioides terrestris]|uniref:512c292a-6255-4351-bd38-07fdc7e3b867 n=1 Tax=Thermothielavioides terrestris TaxID=2587410 RepID=A0A3S4BF68_9PEZI|nr:512c292a-6255-4351-bd38-07fdc7e3b867 [Thermothielavioides terrestris]